VSSVSSLFQDLLSLEDPQLEDAMRSPGLAGLVTSEWHRLAADAEWRKQTAAGRAYRHPNGFIKIVLCTGPEARCARLHFWDRGYADDVPHNHRYDLWSRVLSGWLDNCIYAREEGPDFAECTVTSPSSPAAEYALSSLGSANLRRTAIHRMITESTYSQSFDAIHSIRTSPDIPAVTFVISGPVRQSTSVAYMRKYSGQAAVSGAPLSNEDIAQLAESSILRGMT